MYNICNLHVHNNSCDSTKCISMFLVMSFPADGMEAAYKNNIDEVAAVLDGKHKDHYAVYNLSQRQYSTAK